MRDRTEAIPQHNADLLLHPLDAYDFWDAYAAILPSKRHCACGKDSGQTSHIERFNNTLRQRCSRLVRKTLSFSKKTANHIGAIWYFIDDYNTQQRAKLTTTTFA